MKNILFATSEAVPFIKTGGLADVAGSLPKYFDKRYFDIRVILPVRSHEYQNIVYQNISAMSQLHLPDLLF